MYSAYSSLVLLVWIGAACLLMRVRLCPGGLVIEWSGMKLKDVEEEKAASELEDTFIWSLRTSRKVGSPCFL